MYLTSRFSPIPPFPNKNIEEILFNFPGQEGLPDHTLHIDALTGRRRSKKEFAERVRDASTALGSPASDGGLGLSGEAGDIVGICSTNCMVSKHTLSQVLSESRSLRIVLSCRNTLLSFTHCWR